MLPKSKMLHRKSIMHTKSAKINRTNNNSKLINAITVTKQEHSIESGAEQSVECGLTSRVGFTLKSLCNMIRTYSNPIHPIIIIIEKHLMCG